MTESVKQPCDRGCTFRRRHDQECEDQDTCRGCLPRPAEHGRLCYTCHIRLAEAVQNIPGQVSLLLASLMPATLPDYSAITTAKIPQGLRTEPAMFAKPQMPLGQESEPMRIACLDVAQEIADVLSQIVDNLSASLDAVPPPMLTNGARADGIKRVWREANEHRPEAGYTWVDIEATFGIESARRWLVGNLERWESQEFVADDAETLWDAMSRAHALAPWRDEPKRIPAIPCPYCHAVALKQFGGKSDVTCTDCEMDIPPSRYLIWARMHEEEAAS